MSPAILEFSAKAPFQFIESQPLDDGSPVGAGVGHLAGEEILDQAERQFGRQGVVLLDGSPAREFGIEITTEGVQVQASFPLQALHQILQQGLGIPVHQKIRKASDHQGVVSKRLGLDTCGLQFRQEGQDPRQGLAPQLHHLGWHQRLNGREVAAQEKALEEHPFMGHMLIHDPEFRPRGPHDFRQQVGPLEGP